MRPMKILSTYFKPEQIKQLKILSRKTELPVGQIVRSWVQERLEINAQIEEGDDEDRQDIELAQKRLREIRKSPARLLRGAALEAKLKKWKS